MGGFIEAMKRLPLLYVLIFAFLVLPIILWSVGTQNMEIRSRADEATPSATPTLTPTPTNTPPRCSGLSVSPGSGPKPLTVNFTCSGYDPDNDITAAEFGFGGSEKRLVEKSAGQFGSITTSYTYTKPGSYNVTFRVRDNNMAFSSYPGYCTYTVVVTDNVLTPTPQRTPIPTKPMEEEIIMFTGGVPTVAPTPTSIPTIVAPTPTPELASFWSNEKFAQLAMMVIVSGVTIVIALLLHGFFDKR